MSTHIRFSKKFVKGFKKLNRKTQKRFYDRLKIFEENPYHPTLRNHQLAGEYSQFRSINITGDIRAIYHVVRQEEKVQVIQFDLIGSHSELYE